MPGVVRWWSVVRDMTARLVFSVCLLLLSRTLLNAASPQVAKFTSSGKQVTYEVLGAEGSGPLVIMLHGASGPGVPWYREQAEFFAAHGYTVFFLHYFDAGRSWTASDQNYLVWEKAVSDLVGLAAQNPQWRGRKIGMIGFSLGASVVLSAGSQAVPVNAVAEWYGSLPDMFFMRRKGMPPLLILHGEQDPIIPVINGRQLAQLCQLEHYTCESHFYSGQGHGFQGIALDDARKRTLEFFARTLQ